jgi:hypothetical protein
MITTPDNLQNDPTIPNKHPTGWSKLLARIDLLHNYIGLSYRTLQRLNRVNANKPYS